MAGTASCLEFRRQVTAHANCIRGAALNRSTGQILTCDDRELRLCSLCGDGSIPPLGVVARRSLGEEESLGCLLANSTRNLYIICVNTAAAPRLLVLSPSDITAAALLEYDLAQVSGAVLCGVLHEERQESVCTTYRLTQLNYSSDHLSALANRFVVGGTGGGILIWALRPIGRGEDVAVAYRCPLRQTLRTSSSRSVTAMSLDLGQNRLVAAVGSIVRVWHFVSGEALLKLPLGALRLGGPVSCMSFTSASRLLAMTCESEQRTVSLWRLPKGTEGVDVVSSASLRGARSSITGIASIEAISVASEVSNLGKTVGTTAVKYVVSSEYVLSVDSGRVLRLWTVVGERAVIVGAFQLPRAARFTECTGVDEDPDMDMDAPAFCLAGVGGDGRHQVVVAQGRSIVLFELHHTLSSSAAATTTVGIGISNNPTVIKDVCSVRSRTANRLLRCLDLHRNDDRSVSAAATLILSNPVAKCIEGDHIVHVVTANGAIASALPLAASSRGLGTARGRYGGSSDEPLSASSSFFEAQCIYYAYADHSGVAEAVGGLHVIFVGWEDGHVDVIDAVTGSRLHVLNGVASDKRSFKHSAVKCVVGTSLRPLCDETASDTPSPLSMLVAAGTESGGLLLWTIGRYKQQFESASVTTGQIVGEQIIALRILEGDYLGTGRNCANGVDLLSAGSRGKIKLWSCSLVADSSGSATAPPRVHLSLTGYFVAPSAENSLLTSISLIPGLSPPAIALGDGDGTVELWELPLPSHLSTLRCRRSTPELQRSPHISEHNTKTTIGVTKRPFARGASVHSGAVKSIAASRSDAFVPAFLHGRGHSLGVPGLDGNYAVLMLTCSADCTVVLWDCLGSRREKLSSVNVLDKHLWETGEASTLRPIRKFHMMKPAQQIFFGPPVPHSEMPFELLASMGSRIIRLHWEPLAKEHEITGLGVGPLFAIDVESEGGDGVELMDAAEWNRRSLMLESVAQESRVHGEGEATGVHLIDALTVPEPPRHIYGERSAKFSGGQASSNDSITLQVESTSIGKHGEWGNRTLFSAEQEHLERLDLQLHLDVELPAAFAASINGSRESGSLACSSFATSTGGAHHDSNAQLLEEESRVLENNRALRPSLVRALQPQAHPLPSLRAASAKRMRLNSANAAMPSISRLYRPSTSERANEERANGSLSITIRHPPQRDARAMVENTTLQSTLHKDTKHGSNVFELPPPVDVLQASLISRPATASSFHETRTILNSLEEDSGVGLDPAKSLSVGRSRPGSAPLYADLHPKIGRRRILSGYMGTAQPWHVLINPSLGDLPVPPNRIDMRETTARSEYITTTSIRSKSAYEKKQRQGQYTLPSPPSSAVLSRQSTRGSASSVSRGGLAARPSGSPWQSQATLGVEGGSPPSSPDHRSSKSRKVTHGEKLSGRSKDSTNRHHCKGQRRRSSAAEAVKVVISGDSRQIDGRSITSPIHEAHLAIARRVSKTSRANDPAVAHAIAAALHEHEQDYEDFDATEESDGDMSTSEKTILINASAGRHAFLRKRAGEVRQAHLKSTAHFKQQRTEARARSRAIINGRLHHHQNDKRTERLFLASTRRKAFPFHSDTALPASGGSAPRGSGSAMPIGHADRLLLEARARRERDDWNALTPAQRRAANEKAKKAAEFEAAERARLQEEADQRALEEVELKAKEEARICNMRKADAMEEVKNNAAASKAAAEAAAAAKERSIIATRKLQSAQLSVKHIVSMASSVVGQTSEHETEIAKLKAELAAAESAANAALEAEAQAEKNTEIRAKAQLTSEVAAELAATEARAAAQAVVQATEAAGARAKLKASIKASLLMGMGGKKKSNIGVASV